MWKHFVKETNSFAKRYIHSLCVEGTWSPTSRIARWRNVTVKEMKIFWAIVMNMGLSKRKKLESYWAKDFVHSQPFYRQAMPLFRFQLILSMFHLSSCVSPPMGQPGYDPRVKVRHFMNMMATNFKTYFVPSQEICIDEITIGKKNRCKFNQYMPNKRHSMFGMKQFEVCDSKTAYILNFAFYSCKDFFNDAEEPFTQKVVAHLMRDTGLLGKGYHLFTDNYYSKIPLARFLNTHKTFFTGMVNKNSKELCQTILSTKLPAGNSVYFRKKIDSSLPSKETILFMKYQEKITRKPVQVITTAGHAEDIIIDMRRVPNTKPAFIQKYNQFIRGVDVNDKHLYQNIFSRMSMKYWKKIVFNIMDMAIHNAYCLYKSHNACAISKFEFMTNIIYDLSKSKDPASLNLQPVIPMVGQLSTTPSPPNIHTIKRIPNNNQKVCIVCSRSGKAKKKARFYCPSCQTGVHPDCYAEMVHQSLSPSLNKRQRLI
uniref:PiggyBac transposable element-derived protein domain-containing protein n=1 Tax=Clastoptera arizonana TaxID=38151 RepID=A0A1B6D469_9HEMI